MDIRGNFNFSLSLGSLCIINIKLEITGVNDKITGVDDVTGIKNEDDTQNNNTANNIQRNQNITVVCQNDVNKDTGAINKPKKQNMSDQDDDYTGIHMEK